MQLQVIEEVSLTDVGLKRQHNQDAIGDVGLLSKLVGSSENLAKRGRLYAVADGMGGHVGGEVASHLALQTLFLVYYSLQSDPLDNFKQAVSATNTAVYRAGESQPGPAAPVARPVDQPISCNNNSSEAATGSDNQEGLNESPHRMGTTLTAALLVENTLYTCNIGDSRIYLLHKGKLRQLTRDHSLVGEGLRQGILTKEQARTSPFNNVITRALGLHPQVEADFTEIPLQEQDIILLCSDGLYRVVDEMLIEQALTKMTPIGAAQYLIDTANFFGGPDNISVVIVKVGHA